MIIIVENPQKWDFPVRACPSCTEQPYLQESHFWGFSCVMITTKLLHPYFTFERQTFKKKFEVLSRFWKIKFFNKFRIFRPPRTGGLLAKFKKINYCIYFLYGVPIYWEGVHAHISHLADKSPHLHDGTLPCGPLYQLESAKKSPTGEKPYQCGEKTYQYSPPDGTQ